jgi:AI-2 transport protein TqsA
MHVPADRVDRTPARWERRQRRSHRRYRAKDREEEKMTERVGEHAGAAGHRRDDAVGADGLIRSAGPLTAIGGLVLVLVAVLAVREVASLVVPVMFGLFIALTAWPMVGALERRGVRHGFALVATIVVVLAVGLVATFVAALSVGELVVEIPTSETRLDAALAALRDLLAQLGVSADLGAITAIISPERIFGLVKPVAAAVSDAGGALFVLAFTMIYALAGGASLRTRAVAAFGEQHALVLGMERFGTDLRRYLIVRAKLGLFAAVLSFVLLFVLGVPFAVLWAILVFAASFVPNIGSVVAVIPPTLLAYLDSGLGTAVMVVIGYALINFAQDQFLQPVVMGSELNLSPLVVFIAVVVWAWILGPAGALLAVPLTVGLVMVLEAFPSSRGFAGLLRSRVEPELEATREALVP